MYILLLTSFYIQTLCLWCGLRAAAFSMETYAIVFISTTIRLYWTVTTLAVAMWAVYFEISLCFACVLYVCAWRQDKVRHSATADVATLASLAVLAAALAWNTAHTKKFTLCLALECIACVPEISARPVLLGMLGAKICRVALWLHLYIEGQRYPLLLTIDAVASLILLEHSFMWWSNVKETIAHQLNIV